MEKEILEGSEIIAIFMGEKVLPVKDNDLFPVIEGEFGLRQTKYHTSWDWQVPAWSKIAKLIKKIADDGSEWDYKVYMGLIGRYENAVFNNVPMEGFVVITDAIHFYNTQSK